MRYAPKSITSELFDDLHPSNKYLAVETLLDIVYEDLPAIPKGSKGVAVGSIEGAYLVFFPKSVVPTERPWGGAIVRTIKKSDVKPIGRVGR